jgi:hypothetical protein
MKVLVACEYSGTVRDAFLRRGHDAISCDVTDSESLGPHYTGDVRDILSEKWDLIVAHPPCTYLCASGVSWFYNVPKVGLHGDERYEAMKNAAAFFRLFLTSPCPKVAVENPRMHKYGIYYVGAFPSQTIQPYEFGHSEQKTTCLWLKGLPQLRPTNIVPAGINRLHRLPPSPNRARERARTYPGIAEAMAEQWG